MRKLSAGLALLTLSAAVLVGCSASPSGSCDRKPSADASQVGLVTVTGDAAVPAAAFPTPLHADATQWRDVVGGEGARVVADDQLLSLDITLFSGETGSSQPLTAYGAAAPTVLPLSTWSSALSGLDAALRCAAEGARVVVALSPGNVGERVAAGLGLPAGASAVAVVDVRKVYLDRADGADQFVESHGLPTVVRAADGRPGVIIPDGQPPADLVVRVLKRGDGAVVGADDTVRVQYTGLTWADRTVFDSTWGRAAASLVPSQTIPGFASAISGQTVGSQVLIVVPPGQGYGSRAQGAIPAGSTLVFVVDILGIDPA